MPRPAVLLSPRFENSIKKLNHAEISLVEETLVVIPDLFGRPHTHTGLSIRRLRKNIFECRAGLKIRLLFRFKRGVLEFFFAGNHDEVKRIIRDL